MLKSDQFKTHCKGDSHSSKTANIILPRLTIKEPWTPLCPHIHTDISQRAQRMYLLKLLRHQGMSGEQLSVVTYSIIVSHILYALPAWCGFLSAELTNKINALLGASSDLVTRLATLQCQIYIYWYILTTGRDLIRKLCSSEHSLHHLLPPERKYSNLRNRGHRYELQEYCTNMHKKSFIIQSLHLYIWFFFNF